MSLKKLNVEGLGPKTDIFASKLTFSVVSIMLLISFAFKELLTFFSVTKIVEKIHCAARYSKIPTQICRSSTHPAGTGSRLKGRAVKTVGYGSSTGPSFPTRVRGLCTGDGIRVLDMSKLFYF